MFHKKTTTNYEILLNIINDLYRFLNIFFSIVWFIDENDQIVTNLKTTIFDVSHAFCIWHIEQNVTINCKKNFSTNEIWYEFFDNKKKTKLSMSFNVYYTLLSKKNSIESDKYYKTNMISSTKIYVFIWSIKLFSKNNNDAKFESIKKCTSIIIQFSKTKTIMRNWKSNWKHQLKISCQ